MKTDDTLEKLLIELSGKYGKNAIQPASEMQPLGRIPTGVRALDEILGGGWPKGRVSVLWGPNNAGKTTLALATVAQVQKIWPASLTAKIPVMWHDQENTFEPRWAESLGVDTTRMTRHAPMAAEDAGDLIIQYVRERVPLVVVDSIIEMIPEKSLQRGSGEQEYSPVARFLSSWLPKLVVLQGRSPTVLLFINQVRDKIGFFFGDTDNDPGGHALRHLASLKLKIMRKGFIKGKGRDAEGKSIDVKIGYSTAIKVIKSKVGGETKECRYDLLFGKGIVELKDPVIEEDKDE
jgi:recombination protein RecA